MNLLLSLLTQVIWLQTDIASTQSTARWHFHTEFVKPLLLQSCSIGEIIPFKGHTFWLLLLRILILEVNDNENSSKTRFLVLALTLTMILSLVACGKSRTSIVGTWSSDDGEEVLIFNKDGTCSVPFTYDGGWWESCDRYSVDDDGTLVLSSSKGNIDSKRFRKQDSAEDVEENGGYYLSGNKLIILDFRTLRSYTRK